jgi:hypothetical protein
MTAEVSAGAVEGAHRPEPLTVPVAHGEPFRVDVCVECGDNWPCPASIAYAAGVAAGRAQAAASALMSARDELRGVADRLREKARTTGDKTHVGTAAGVHLACLRLVELADKIAAEGPGNRETPDA